MRDVELVRFRETVRHHGLIKVPKHCLVLAIGYSRAYSAIAGCCESATN